MNKKHEKMQTVSIISWQKGPKFSNTKKNKKGKKCCEAAKTGDQNT